MMRMKISIPEIVTLITAFIGGGGISAVITARVAAKKQDADNRHTDQETEGLRIQNEITEMDYINKRLQEISEISKKEAEELRKKNEALNDKISELNHKMQSLMEWIVTDNYKYRSWLENELKQVNPDVQFPETTKPPAVFDPPKEHDES